MRLLVAIPHYFDRARAANPGARHGSLAGDPGKRVVALSSCIAALHQLYGHAQHVIEIATRNAPPANALTSGVVHVVICTTADHHLLGSLPLPSESYTHQQTSADPRLLGFECHGVLRDRIGDYDYYAYLEDDLIARDPWFFRKLAWFNAQLGDGVLLQPNRYEVGPLGLVHKAYIDGDLDPRATSAFQNLDESPEVSAPVFGATVRFRRARNPHAGAFFLNARQMADWVSRPYFLDRDTTFIGPLESAATLGIMRTFRVYKPAPETASFLEIEHHGTAFLSQLRRRSADT